MVSYNNDGNYYEIAFDTAKEGGELRNLNDYFKARVGDNGTPLVVRFYTQGLLNQFKGTEAPIVEGDVGNFTIDTTKTGSDQLVMAPDAQSISWKGDRSDMLPGGRILYKLPAQLFPQSGAFKGFIGYVDDSDGGRRTGVDIWFRVLDGPAQMGKAVNFYIGELDAAIHNANEQIRQQGVSYQESYDEAKKNFANQAQTTIDEVNQKYRTDTQASIDALLQARVELSKLGSTASQIAAGLQSQDYVHIENFKKLENDMEDKISSIKTSITTFKTLADLKSKYPDGADGIFVTFDTGHKYSYIDGEWIDGGVYQAEGSLSEIEDARIWEQGFGDKKSTTLGDAIRGQVANLENQLADVLTSKEVSLLDDDGQPVIDADGKTLTTYAKKVKTDDTLTDKDLPATAKAVGDALKLDSNKYSKPYNWYGGTTMPILSLVGSLPVSDGDKSTLTYSYRGKTGQAKLKWQGQSSKAFPKKNYTIKFDQKFIAKDGWLTTDEYVLKGNFNDFTHARNVVSAQLWADVVKSRSWGTTVLLDNDGTPLLDSGQTFDVFTDTLPGLAGAGATDGFPVALVVNDKYVGLYDFQIKKGTQMFGFSSDNHNQYALSCERTDDNANDKSIVFKGEADLDGKDFDYEYTLAKADQASAKKSFNTMIDAVIGATGADYGSAVNPYLDMDSIIDYMIFTSLITATDDVTKNYLMLSYDGTKWYISAYDLDCTFGNWQDGWLRESPATATPTLKHWDHVNRAMHLAYAYDTERLKARYQQLRQGPLSEASVFQKFVDYMALTSQAVRDEELKLWPSTPSSATHTLDQIMTHYRLRTQLIDNEINQL